MDGDETCRLRDRLLIPLVAMTPSRPYLIRALYEWIVDNEMTPYVLVDAEHSGAQVPSRYVENGKIVLNVAPAAVNDLQMNNSAVAFNARFGGAPHNIVVPVQAVVAIYARENGKGMVFTDEGGDDTSPPSDPGTTKSKRPNLHVVK